MSRRALLPDPEPEKQSAKPRSASLSNDNVVSPKTLDKGKPKKALTVSNDGSASRSAESLKDKTFPMKLSSPGKEAAKRLVSPEKDGPDKPQMKKSGGNISSKSGNAVVNGEAKVV